MMIMMMMMCQSNAPLSSDLDRWSKRTPPYSSEDNTGFRGHEIEWPPLEDFFLGPDVDARAARLGESESTITEPAPVIAWHSGGPVWEPQGRLVKTPLRQDSDLYDPAEIPDFVVLSRQSFGANPDLGAAWAHDQIDDGADVLRDWEQIAAVGVLGVMKKSDDTSEYECVFPATRLKHHLRLLAAESPIRSHTFGFTLDGSILTLYLHTPSGLFYSSDIECTEANGHLSTFIERLLSLNDLDLGKIASPGRPDGPPLPFPIAALPPWVPAFTRHHAGVSAMRSIEIEKTVFCSGEILGLQTSASRVQASRDGLDGDREYAMTVSFVEEARCDEHDRIRLAIANASPDDRQGLTHIVDVYRESDFVVVPRFLPKMLDAKAWGLKPRAMEVVFHEHCFDPISVIESTEALAQVMLGAVHGLRSLYRLRILNRDVSAANVMIASDGKGVLIDYGTAVLMEGEAERRKSVVIVPARGKLWRFAGKRPFADDLKKIPILHQPWHEIELLVYVAIFVVFILPKGASDPAETSDAARGLWEHWKAPITGVLMRNALLTSTEALQSLFEPYVEYWKHVPELVATLAKYCGLGVQRAWNERVDEKAAVEPRWATGELSHDRLASDLHALIERIVQKNTSESECGTTGANC